MDVPLTSAEGLRGGDCADSPYIARQPIYNESINLFSYELLQQTDIFDSASAINAAKAETFLNGLLAVDLEPFVGENRAFVQVPTEFIVNEHSMHLPADRFVLVVPGEIEQAEGVLRSFVKTREAGISIALNNFRYSERNRRLLELADYVNIDFRNVTPELAAAHIRDVKNTQAKLVAKQIRTYDEFEKAKSIGFDYFDGPCFLRPKTKRAEGIPPNRIAMLQLVRRLQEPESDMVELERIISLDVAISYRLLRYVNSALISLSNNIESIKHAIQLVGMERIRLWASILIMFGFDDTPSELVITAFVRATMAQRLAESMHVKSPDSYFTTGLFSVLDVMLDLPMKRAVELVPLAEPIRDAITDLRGLMGMVLSCVLAYEAADWGRVRCGSLPPAAIRQCYLAAISAATELRKAAA